MSYAVVWLHVMSRYGVRTVCCAGRVSHTHNVVIGSSHVPEIKHITRLMLMTFRKTLTACSKNQINPINQLCGLNTSLNAKISKPYTWLPLSYKDTIKGYRSFVARLLDQPSLKSNQWYLFTADRPVLFHFLPASTCMAPFYAAYTITCIMHQFIFVSSRINCMTYISDLLWFRWYIHKMHRLLPTLKIFSLFSILTCF
jgi:hypothetical protein